MMILAVVLLFVAPAVVPIILIVLTIGVIMTIFRGRSRY
jgi:hypothetical protein